VLDSVAWMVVASAPLEIPARRSDVANHASAEKRNRQRIKRTARNRAVKSEFRTLVKAVRQALNNGNIEAAKAALKPATSALDAAVTKGVLHRASASRRVSRIVSAVHKAEMAKKSAA